ncbi:TVP38/TMEM64 family protein [Oscillatoria sp. FACHB-1407]|uniref:TVP38/TMEM64 family protein n=1 Tax=Oscillatoria sp. FACHB-1407 TaxID=2692847 RepID=UPI001681C8B8|nr:TVP38/TMEM64 family protein [Oscillatoria sp. FACHB-1407]MBD2464306.1 TVP38/TMEM64 family protein [Oscillatoria sp. FACHB-1407]
MNSKIGILLLLAVCVAVTVVAAHELGRLDQAQIQAWLKQAGVWAPLGYVLLYVLGTLLMLPSTPLNLTGGALFGVWWGTLWTSIAAIIAAIAAFAFTRTLGREAIAKRFTGRWQTLDTEIRQGGVFYMFAVRLLPLLPYGLVNFTAGLTSIRFQDYLIGTALGTVPGILPFVMLGAGLRAMTRGDIVPLMLASGMLGILVGFTTWYRRRKGRE